jgi:putative transposase
MRMRYRFAVVGYVVMPEHVHVLISEPLISDPSTVVQAVKLGFVQRWRGVSPLLAQSAREKWGTQREKWGTQKWGVQSVETSASGQFWQSRFYDFNVWSQRKVLEKLKYMHRNPVVRGLVDEPDDWKWSSYRSYAYGEDGLVWIDDWSWWEEKIRKRVG